MCAFGLFLDKSRQFRKNLCEVFGMKLQCWTDPLIRALVTKESLRQFYEKSRTKLSQRDCCCDPHLHTNQSGYDVKSHRMHWLMQADNFSLTCCPIYIVAP